MVHIWHFSRVGRWRTVDKTVSNIWQKLSVYIWPWLHDSNSASYERFEALTSENAADGILCNKIVKHLGLSGCASARKLFHLFSVNV